MSAKWFHFEERDIAVACIPKIATSSIQDAISKGYVYKNTDEILNVSTRVAWIREPIIRLQSAYSFFNAMYKQSSYGGTYPTEDQCSTWEKFVDCILVNEDKHWRPQADFIVYEGKVVSNFIYKFEDIQKTWSNHFDGLLPWLRACKHLPINNYRRDEINEYYKRDIELWSGL